MNSSKPAATDISKQRTSFYNVVFIPNNTAHNSGYTLRFGEEDPNAPRMMDDMSFSLNIVKDNQILNPLPCLSDGNTTMVSLLVNGKLDETFKKGFCYTEKLEEFKIKSIYLTSNKPITFKAANEFGYFIVNENTLCTLHILFENIPFVYQALTTKRKHLNLMTYDVVTAHEQRSEINLLPVRTDTYEKTWNICDNGIVRPAKESDFEQIPANKMPILAQTISTTARSSSSYSTTSTITAINQARTPAKTIPTIATSSSSSTTSTISAINQAQTTSTTTMSSSSSSTATTALVKHMPGKPFPIRANPPIVFSLHFNIHQPELNLSPTVISQGYDLLFYQEDTKKQWNCKFNLTIMSEQKATLAQDSNIPIYNSRIIPEFRSMPSQINPNEQNNPVFNTELVHFSARQAPATYNASQDRIEVNNNTDAAIEFVMDNPTEFYKMAFVTKKITADFSIFTTDINGVTQYKKLDFAPTGDYSYRINFTYYDPINNPDRKISAHDYLRHTQSTNIASNVSHTSTTATASSTSATNQHKRPLTNNTDNVTATQTNKPVKRPRSTNNATSNATTSTTSTSFSPFSTATSSSTTQLSPATQDTVTTLLSMRPAQTVISSANPSHSTMRTNNSNVSSMSSMINNFNSMYSPKAKSSIAIPKLTAQIGPRNKI